MDAKKQPVKDEKKEATPKLHGHSTFTQKIADKICEQMASGISLREVCRGEGMPPEATVRNWVVSDVLGFATQYARAREEQAHAMAEEILVIADDARNDWMERNSGGVELNAEHVQRSRLRMDARRWLASKILPKQYADRVDTNVSGDLTVHKIISDTPMTKEDWAAMHGADEPK